MKHIMTDLFASYSFLLREAQNVYKHRCLFPPLFWSFVMPQNLVIGNLNPPISKMIFSHIIMFASCIQLQFYYTICIKFCQHSLKIFSTIFTQHSSPKRRGPPEESGRFQTGGPFHFDINLSCLWLILLRLLLLLLLPRRLPLQSSFCSLP